MSELKFLKDGATSLYGSDAVAGVINFHTYHAFDGLRISATAQKTSNYDQKDNSLGLLYGGDALMGTMLLLLVL